MLTIVFFKITILVVLFARALNRSSGIVRERWFLSSQYWAKAIPSFPHTPQSLYNLTIIAYGNDGINGDQICCSLLSTLSSTSSTLSTRFILISGLSITTICITVFHCTCYHCMLFTHHKNKEADESRPSGLLSSSCVLRFC